jgi:hypothetical protein
MPANQERLWHELGIIAAIYLGSVVVYTIVMGNFYGENTGADIPELLKQIPKFLRPRMGARDKVDLVILAISVVIYTLPLAISSALIGYATRARSLSFILVIVCIVGHSSFTTGYSIATSSATKSTNFHTIRKGGRRLPFLFCYTTSRRSRSRP